MNEEHEYDPTWAKILGLVIGVLLALIVAKLFAFFNFE